MNPFLFSQQNIPPVHKLWKNEVSKYRLWVVLFLIGLSVVVLLTFAGILLAAVKYNDGVAVLLNNQPSGTKLTYENAVLVYVLNDIVFPTLIFGVVAGALGYAIASIVKSYRLKSFSHISRGALLAVQVLSFFALFMIFEFLFSSSKTGISGITNIPGALISFIVYFLYIPVWFFTNKLSSIRKYFLLSEHAEKLKKDPRYQQTQAQMKEFMQNPNFQSNPFNQPKGKSPFGPFPTNTKKETPTNPQTISKDSPVKSQSDRKLAGLSLTQLRAIAKELFISGYQTMSRSELIHTIKRSTTL